MIRAWLASSLVRHFPLSPARPSRPFSLDAALNERVSFQVGFRMEDGPPQRVRLEVRAPGDVEVRIRRVGYVPVRHHNTQVPAADLDGRGFIPGYVPDPLFDEDSAMVPGGETHAFYVTVQAAAGVAPGPRTLRVALVPEKGGGRQVLQARLRLHDVHIRPRRNFPLTNWFYNDALLDYYRCAPFDDRYWEILPNYFRDMALHGQDMVYVPVFTPPLDGVKRPTQLLGVTRGADGRYRFEWRDVRRYVRLASRCGVRNFEWTHLFTQWGARNAIRIYRDQGADEHLLWKPDTTATSGTYRNFLAQFLPQFHAFLSREQLLKRSFFHVSDEPHGEEHKANYIKARGQLRDLAPWMKVMDALSEITYGEERLIDTPIPSIQTALEFVKRGIPCGCYYCCGPRGLFLNRLLDSSLAKIRMNGWLFYRWPFQMFLHWGYNYWYRSQTRELIDPYHVQDGHAWERGWAYGDPFMVYPGPTGPVDSMRWEAFGDSLQEYALLQTLNVDRDDRLLSAIHTFEDFPKSERWILSARRHLFARARKASSRRARK